MIKPSEVVIEVAAPQHRGRGDISFPSKGDET